jgi:hypothetical protein
MEDLESVYKVPNYPLCNYCSISGGDLIIDEDLEVRFIPTFKRSWEHVKDLI